MIAFLFRLYSFPFCFPSQYDFADEKKKTLGLY